VAKASGPDVTRSTLGRIGGESIWLPSALCCGIDVTWTETGPSNARARFPVQGETAELDLNADTTGRLRSVHLPRWGNPEGGTAFHYADFGGVLEEEGTFGGYTIPTRVRVGWYFGSDRFASDGEFFRATIDDARYR
jgi:hypothetical protein